MQVFCLLLLAYCFRPWVTFLPLPREFALTLLLSVIKSLCGFPRGGTEDSCVQMPYGECVFPTLPRKGLRATIKFSKRSETPFISELNSMLLIAYCGSDLVCVNATFLPRYCSRITTAWTHNVVRQLQCQVPDPDTGSCSLLCTHKCCNFSHLLRTQLREVIQLAQGDAAIGGQKQDFTNCKAMSSPGTLSYACHSPFPLLLYRLKQKMRPQ